MKNSFLYLLIFIFVLQNGVHGQNPNDIIIPSSIDLKFLEHLTKLQIDSVRKSYKLNALINDRVLYSAAIDHAKYLREKNTLGHFQPDNKTKKTPQDRIDYYGAKDILAGENVIEIYIHTNTRFKKDPTSSTHVVSTYQQAAHEMMTGWINSPPHFANIITKDYALTGMGIEYDSLTQSIRGVQVFGRLLYPQAYAYNADMLSFPYEKMNMDSLLAISAKIKGKYHKRHAWKLSMPVKKKDIGNCKSCDQLVRDPDDFYSVIMDDSLYYFFANKSQLENTFKKKKDGLALEIIPLEYYNCNSDLYYTLPSRKNGRCIFNGKVTKPVYKKDLKSKIRHEKEWKNNVLVNMGFLHDSLKNNPFEINLILIKNNKVCNIVQMSGVCGVPYNYIPGKFPYNCVFQNVNALPKVKQDTVTLTVYFEQNKWDYDVSQIEPALDVIKNNNYEILKAMLNSFASVEGTEELNENLYNNRARAIISKFEEKQDSAISMKITMQENWPLFFKQIKGTKWESLGDLDTLSIRKKINDPAVTAELEPLLKKQRLTYVNLIARYKINDSNIDSLIFLEFSDLFDKLEKKFLKTSPLNLSNDSKRDIARLEELYQFFISRKIENKLKDDRILTLEIPVNAAYGGLLFYSAFFKYSEKIISEEEYFNYLLEIIETKTKNAAANYHYIAFLINHLDNSYYKSLLSSDNIKYFIDVLSAENFEKEKLDQLQLLYHFYLCKESLFSSKPKKITTSLSFIYNYYRSNPTPDSVIFSVSSHMIAFRKYDYARKLLEPIISKPEPDVNAYKLYLHLLYSGQAPMNNSDYYQEIITSAETLSDEDWCGLFLDECRITFQLLDYEPLRNLFCLKCKVFDKTNK